mmetsp:Transcript_30003/g.39464  ORF Transcript_30003/g.39464 Transcript_30003/m.39464 type:complete len:99 (-) Transcript_30003:105-401(-)
MEISLGSLLSLECSDTVARRAAGAAIRMLWRLGVLRCLGEFLKASPDPVGRRPMLGHAFITQSVEGLLDIFEAVRLLPCNTCGLGQVEGLPAPDGEKC